MTAALYSWMSADLDPSTEPYNLVGSSRFQAKSNMVKPVCANVNWQHNQWLKYKLAVNRLKDHFFKIMWKTDHAIGTPRFVYCWTFLWTLQLKMQDKGHLVTRHLIVRLQLRVEECSGDPLNKRTAVWSHNPELSHGPGGISPDPQFRELVVLHKSWPLYSCFLLTVWGKW